MSVAFKIDLRPGTKLSEHFVNRRHCYKIVETENVLGYVVSRGGRESAAAIFPLYRAYIHIKAGKTWHIVPSYEQGERLNAATFHADYVGCTFSTIASQAINALEERGRCVAEVPRLQQLVNQGAAKKKRPSRQKGRVA